MENRRRLSIDLPPKLFNDLNNSMEGLRLKNAVFQKITEDLVEVLSEMQSIQKRIFIIAVAGGKLSLKEWNPVISKLLTTANGKD